MLSGHTDVVPIDGQSWSSDPFTATARGTRLHGRGACDMKGFIASVLSRVPRCEQAKLRRPIYLLFSYDEEVGCVGAPSMIQAVRETLPTPAVAIVGEPTHMRIATQHKGMCQLRTRVTGIEAHSSLTHQGVSAVMLAGELIGYLNQLATQLAVEIKPSADRFEPPYTTISVNRIEGGSAINILAARCEFFWDIRALPGETANRILSQFTGAVQERLATLAAHGKLCQVHTRIQAEAPPLNARDGPAEVLVRSVLPDAGEPLAVAFATEGGQFQQAGWSTVVCGPGSIEQAHKPDEFIELSELSACDRFLDRLIARHCAR